MANVTTDRCCLLAGWVYLDEMTKLTWGTTFSRSCCKPGGVAIVFVIGVAVALVVAVMLVGGGVDVGVGVGLALALGVCVGVIDE